MKKAYAMMALALAAGLSAQANAPKSFSDGKAEMPTEIYSYAELLEANNVSSNVAKSPAKISAVSDVYGPYVISSMKWGLSGAAPSGIAPLIEAGDSPTQVYISNFPNSLAECVATIDVANSTLTITEQDAYYNTNYNEMVKWMIRSTETGSFLPEVVATINADGTITFPENIMVSLKLPSYEPDAGYFFGAISMVFERIYAFQFDASEWTSAGKAEFLDGYINNALYEEYRVPAYEVEVMKHNTIEGDYLLVNPYKNDAWTNAFGIPFTDGYLRFNIAYPDCAYVYPLVKSGSLAPVSETAGEYTYNYNQEGLMVTQGGYTPEEVFDEFDANYTPISYYDETSNTVFITNMLFGLGEAEMLGTYWWTGLDPETEMSTEIKLDFSGIDGVEVDNSNAPVKYFNLQGVEVANPEQGQLLIKKQGSKAQKIVVR